MKKIVLFLLFFAVFPCAASAQGAEAGRPSISHGSGKTAYAGNVTGGVSFIGFFLSTSHGVIFDKSNIYVGSSAEYYFLWGRNFINVAADGRCFWPSSGRVQGYVGLEAGVSVRLPGTYFNNASGDNEYNPGDAEFFVRPALGLVVNFAKVSLDIGVKCSFSPYVTMGSNGRLWSPIPSLGVGLWF